MLHWMPIVTGPRAPVPLLSVTCSPREAVCAVPYSQLRPDPPTASSLHCWRIGAVESIAQNDVTVVVLMSFRPASSLVGAACSCWRVHACEHAKFALHAALAPGSPSCALKLKRPTVAGSAPLTDGGVDGHVVVVVEVVVDVVVVEVVVVEVVVVEVAVVEVAVVEVVVVEVVVVEVVVVEVVVVIDVVVVEVAV